MGQEEIAKILKNKYPLYISSVEISLHCNISLRSIMRCLASLEKRNEVEFKIIQGKKPNSGWKKLYRIKGGNNNGR